MIERIVSGGQTGVDRAALDVALEMAVPCGGWCPRDRWSEAGPIDERYPLTETRSRNPARRTRRNVRDADGTLIIASGAADDLTGGTALTRRFAVKLRRPHLVVDPDAAGAPAAIRAWLATHEVKVLNVAGPRESGCPGIYDRASRLLRAVLGR